MPHKDLFRSANQFIDQHGEDALIQAMNKQAFLSAAGDSENAYIWTRIADAIEFIQMSANLTGEL